MNDTLKNFLCIGLELEDCHIIMPKCPLLSVVEGISMRRTLFPLQSQLPIVKKANLTELHALGMRYACMCVHCLVI